MACLSKNGSHMRSVYHVCIPHTLRDFFDYYAGDIEPSIGARVWVPFGRQKRMGVVIGEHVPDSPRLNMKFIETLIDERPVLSGESLVLCHWISNYYQSPLSEVLPLALPKKYRNGDELVLPTCQTFQLTMAIDEAYPLLSKRAIRQRALVDFFALQQIPQTKKMIQLAGFSMDQVDALLTLGILSIHIEIEKPANNQLLSQPLSLNPEQALAVQTIQAHMDTYQCFLLHGVTGSGKTEVYLQVIAKILAAGRQVLVLVPEIGLTPQLLARFRQRFREPMVVIHSKLSDSERQRAWHWAKEETVKLVVGTRAAIFTPMPALGLIVIDEEHDTSFKQMEGVRYSARDTALMRAHLRHIPIVLGSATPSLESLYNCQRNKYTLLRLNHKALESRPLQYQILDIRNQTLKHGLADPTLRLIEEHLQRQQQVLVFINRRGFAPVFLCHQCGWIADCRACDAHLTLHRTMGRLICHHCGLIQAIPRECHACHGRELLPIGTGTQRVHDFLTHYFPTTSIVRIDRDEVRKKLAFDDYLSRINSGQAQLIIGTQMLAKGHHFPQLTLVVILDADNGFYNQDFRALEHLGQLLMQVAGRAGRAELPGQVLIQTHLPKHPLLNQLVQQGYDDFANELLVLRRQASLPPYHFLTLIRAQGKALPGVLNFLHEVKAQLNNFELQIWGPAPAPLARKGGMHRLQLLLKSPSRRKLKEALTQLRSWLILNKSAKSIRWNIDVDPMDLS